MRLEKVASRLKTVADRNKSPASIVRRVQLESSPKFVKFAYRMKTSRILLIYLKICIKVDSLLKFICVTIWDYKRSTVVDFLYM